MICTPTNPANEDVNYAINGRNEITAADETIFTYDANRMTMAGSAAMTYGPTRSLVEFGTR